MPYTHYIEAKDNFTFAYDIEAEQPPVLRYGYGATAITYVPSYFSSGMDPVLYKIIDNKRYHWLNEKGWLNEETEE